ncbi:MAG: hypothetical protein M1814_002364 [Vezdaea aestivalis]|nr:MAG: hypothetical protein M1814_002364 [Vezdaea aestivalis]
MSLAERLSAMDTIEGNGRAFSPDGKDRRLSFNPVSTWMPPVAYEEPVGAFEVPKTKRLFQIAFAVVYCLLAAGIVFGYAAIKPVFIEEGVYREYCTKTELEQDLGVCYKQELRLNLMFTCAAVATNVCALPVGAILDKYGPRLCSIIGCFFLALGAFVMGFAKSFPFDGYIPGYLFLALGGPFVFIPAFQLSNAFPSNSGLILSMLTGAFDSSSAIFLIYRLAYKASGGKYTPSKFFLSYLVIPAAILLIQIFVMPGQSYKTVSELRMEAEIPEDPETDPEIQSASGDRRDNLIEDYRIRRESVVGEITELLGSKGAERHAKKEELKRARSGVYGVLHGKTASQQIATPWFWLITLFTVVQMTRINYFVATVRPQYQYLLGSFKDAVEVNTFFDVALPLGGLIAVPFIGFILDNASTPATLALLVGSATIIGVLGTLPFKGAAFANIALFVIYRPLYYTTVSDYAAKVFGFDTFGKVYGLIICLAGLFNFSQSALDALTHQVFNGDPIPANVLLMSIALVVGGSLVGFVWWRKEGLKRERLEDEAEDATERLMPTAETIEEE